MSKVSRCFLSPRPPDHFSPDCFSPHRTHDTQKAKSERHFSRTRRLGTPGFRDGDAPAGRPLPAGAHAPLPLLGRYQRRQRDQGHQRDKGQKPKGNRQRPYRRRSSNPSPAAISPNTALRPFGSISGTAEPLTGLARRKPKLPFSNDGSNERLLEDDR